MKKITLLLFIILLLQGCKDSECDTCFTPPGEFIFEIINKNTGENMFTNNTYTPENISIVNTKNNQPIEFSFIPENKYNLIIIYSIGWKTATTNLTIRISDKELCSLYVDAERKYENCCTFTRYKEIKLSNTEFEFDKKTGIYKILVDSSN